MATCFIFLHDVILNLRFMTGEKFRPAGQRLGFDLISLNIQRGRDHGLPPYVWMLYYLTGNYLQQSLPFTFDQLVPRIPLEVSLAVFAFMFS